MQVPGAPAVVLSIIWMGMIGGIWYGPLFRSTFMRLAYGKRKPKGDQRRKYMVMTLTNILTVLLLQLVLRTLGAKTVQDGLAVAAGLGAFDILINVGHDLFEERPLGLFLIHHSYHLAYLSTICPFLAAVRSV
ncbi:hypothetical protein WJX72_008111 [[Myrmecia] bisecta]|uniref:Uncharacterized protein n=1 Tax=[Myrmecia] bisecta TaxID=41462 RepID=A0AAW1QFR9_9CHLO